MTMQDTIRLRKAHQRVVRAKAHLALVEELISVKERNVFLEAEYDKQVQAGHDRLASDLDLSIRLLKTS